MADCKHDCEKPPVFPLTIFNRPALDDIQYRIGTYSRLREHMLDQLNEDQILQNWTHRGADDPGIALLEANAVVGDILAFYQNLYANEAFLRTAEWPESVAELVQLSGYRLAPGVGGEATFALKIKGDNAVTVPAGFGFKAKLADREKDDEFESIEEITAYPHLSEFNLYTPPNAMQSINSSMTRLELDAGTGVEFNTGDRIMLVPDSSMFDSWSAPYVAQDKAEILMVKSVETSLNRVVIQFEGALQVNRGSQIRAFKIDRSFRHFGHGASRQYAAHTLNAADEITDVRLETTEFTRKVNGNTSGGDYYSGYGWKGMPLDQTVDDLALGGQLICQGVSNFDDYSSGSKVVRTNQRFTVVKTISELSDDNFRWGNLEASTTAVTLTEGLIHRSNVSNEDTDIRRTVFHEVISPELTLRAETTFPPGDFSDGDLNYFGTYAAVKALAERNLLLVDSENEIVQAVKTTSTLDDFSSQLASRNEADSWLWTVSLDQVPDFSHDDFLPQEPAITVYGNRVLTNQGKTEDQVVLGSGDSRETFQTFAIPKSPLTYLLDESQTPAQVPELDVYVNDILWQRVENFFDRATDTQIYVVREDHDGNSFVQFGDGINGARLPSGQKNIVAVFRSGIGAIGKLETDKKPNATGKLPQLDKVFLPAEVVGGGEAESMDNAREVAPGKMQSLGRLVGLADFEAETLALPGVIKVSADWSAATGTPLIRIVVLTETATAPAVDKVQSSLNGYNRCRGPARFPIVAVQGVLQYVYLNIRVGYQAAYRQADVEATVKLALGIDSDSGLFALGNRRFGQTAHRSQILAAVQQVEAVSWVEIDDAQTIDLGSPVETDPTALSKPTIASTHPLIGCLPERILALHGGHFDINLVQDDTAKECES